MHEIALRRLPRALHRAEDGRTLTRDEIAALMVARGAALDRLLHVAGSIRAAAPWYAPGAAGRDDRGRLRITYSKKVFVPLTHLCRDTCGYCTFAWPPKADVPAFLSPEEVIAIAEKGRKAGCKEVLFTLGDQPELRYPAARRWLDERGYGSTLEYLRAVAIQVMESTGMLPHLNPGVMSWAQQAALRQVAPSLGMMIETTAERLAGKGGPHHGAPDKQPQVRLRTLEDAGRLAIPFTSGLLIGIGEDLSERADTLLALRDVHRRYGHLQEVIVQPFRAKPDTAMRDHPEPDLEDLLATVAAARIALGPTVHLQAPPNLEPDDYPRLLEAGIDDWGGISPVTPDHVNPEAPWPALQALEHRTERAGFVLAERLCVYPEYVVRPDPWIAAPLRPLVARLAAPDGYARPDVEPEPFAWQEHDLAATVQQPSARMAGVLDGDPRDDAHAVRSPDIGVYGNLEAVVERFGAARAPSSTAQRSGRLDHTVRRALDRAAAGIVIDDHEALALLEVEGEELVALAKVADEVCRQTVGDVATYVVNRNINFTNICYTGCRFCAFAQRRDDPDAYNLSLDEIADRAEEAVSHGATEVCLQGGIHPDLPGDYYFAVLDAIRRRTPQIHIHAFSPMEVVNGAIRMGISVRDWLTEAKYRGLGSIPGTAAEILDDDVRWVLTKGKLPADQWIDVVTTAHDVGLPSSSTMMYGHVDHPRHWVDHIKLLRSLQERTGGFTEFVPLPFVHQYAPIYLAGVARPGPSWEDDRRVHAVARLLLQGAIDHVQVSWVKIGLAHASQLLRGGADDLGGTLMEETISRMAGSQHGVRQSPAALAEAARAAGRQPLQRTTTYRLVASADASA